MDSLQASAPSGADSERAFVEKQRHTVFEFSRAGPDGGVQAHRARACAASLVLMHRLRARLDAHAQASMREQAARLIGLTARLWLS